MCIINFSGCNQPQRDDVATLMGFYIEKGSDGEIDWSKNAPYYTPTNPFELNGMPFVMTMYHTENRDRTIDVFYNEAYVMLWGKGAITKVFERKKNGRAFVQVAWKDAPGCLNLKK